jgi:hypothetical protein
METIDSFGKLILIYQTIQCHIREDCNLQVLILLFIPSVWERNFYISASSNILLKKTINTDYLSFSGLVGTEAAQACKATRRQ